MRHITHLGNERLLFNTDTSFYDYIFEKVLISLMLAYKLKHKIKKDRLLNLYIWILYDKVSTRSFIL